MTCASLVVVIGLAVMVTSAAVYFAAPYIWRGRLER